jgi:cephalosporin hydroxylase
MSDTELFAARNVKYINGMKRDRRLKKLSLAWMKAVTAFEYSYHFTWFGRPIIQFPQDIVAMQQIIWQVKPNVVIETGIARGGSLVFYASMLELLGGDRVVVGIDIDIRPHNRQTIAEHPLSKRIRMIEGSSIASGVVDEVRRFVQGHMTVLVALDSNHTYAHVKAELDAYAGLVTPGSYCVVFDTIIDSFPARLRANRPWRPGNSPKTAVDEFLKYHDEFKVDEELEASLLISVAPGGYLKRVR